MTATITAPPLQARLLMGPPPEKGLRIHAAGPQIGDTGHRKIVDRESIGA
jgi:hypothetical protein